MRFLCQGNTGYCPRVRVPSRRHRSPRTGTKGRDTAEIAVTAAHAAAVHLKVSLGSALVEQVNHAMVGDEHRLTGTWVSSEGTTALAGRSGGLPGPGRLFVHLCFASH